MGRSRGADSGEPARQPLADAPLDGGWHPVPDRECMATLAVEAGVVTHPLRAGAPRAGG